jgi:hypothetical protein
MRRCFLCQDRFVRLAIGLLRRMAIRPTPSPGESPGLYRRMAIGSAVTPG